MTGRIAKHAVLLSFLMTAVIVSGAFAQLRANVRRLVPDPDGSRYHYLAPVWVGWTRPDGALVSPCGGFPVVSCHEEANDWLRSEGLYRLEVTESVGRFRTAVPVRLDGTEVGATLDVRGSAIQLTVQHRPPRGLELLVGEGQHYILRNGTDADLNVVTRAEMVEAALERWDGPRSAWLSLRSSEHTRRDVTKTQILARGHSVRVRVPAARGHITGGWYRITVSLGAGADVVEDGVTVSHRTLVERRWSGSIR